MDGSAFYTPLAQAISELRHRRNDPVLMTSVANSFGGKVPEPFQAEARAVLVRSVAACDLEFLHFTRLAGEAGLLPVVFEDVEDRFSTQAADKIGLVKLHFLRQYDRHGNPVILTKKIADMPGCDGMRFRDVPTAWGESLVDFHHRLLGKYSPVPVEVFRDMDWHTRNVGAAQGAREYYDFLFSYFICHGIQFENYITDSHEQRFFEEIVLPAWLRAQERFGVRPLVVELVPGQEAANPYWWCFGGEIYDNEVKDLLASGSCREARP
jgi:hypothetical protein